MPEHVYRDRKMLKWMPFNALVEHSDYLQELVNDREKKTMPLLSIDQYAELNYNLTQAVENAEMVKIEYYENYRYYNKVGYISALDVYNKLIFIDDFKLSVAQIIAIEII